MRGIPGREGLEPQFKVGDRVETVGLGDSIIFTIQQVWHDGEDWCYDRRTGQCYTARHLKLLPQLMICAGAGQCDKGCESKHYLPHAKAGRCEYTWCHHIHRDVGACIPYVEQQMVDVLPLVEELVKMSGFNSESKVTWPMSQAKLRAILAPYMEGSDE